MNLEEEKLKKLEEEILKDSEDTLPSSENLEDTEKETDEVVGLNSTPTPTEAQISEAAETSPDAIEPETEPATTSEISGETIEAISEPVDAEMTEEQKSVEEEMIPQSQVNEIVGRTRTETRDKTKAETMKCTFDRYGVSDEAGLDGLVSNAQKYDMLRDDYDELVKQLNEAKIKLAMYDSGIAPERYEDARLILQGKGLDVTSDNILAEMETHPEWKKSFGGMEPESEVEQNFQKIEQPRVSTIARLGNDKPEAQSEPSERELAMRLFK